MKEKNIKNFISTIFKAVSLAMGVAVTVLSVMNEIDTATAIRLLAIGLSGSGLAHIVDIKRN